MCINMCAFACVYCVCILCMYVCVLICMCVYGIVYRYVLLVTIFTHNTPELSITKLTIPLIIYHPNNPINYTNYALTT